MNAKLLVTIPKIFVSLSRRIGFICAMCWALGGVFVLYPIKEDLSSLERLALSIGLSLALTPLVGLALNYMPWGIRLNSIFTALSLLTILLAILALNRKFSRFKLAVEPVKAEGKTRKRNPR